MSTRHRGRLVVLCVLALLGALLPLRPAAANHGSSTLQVLPEVPEPSNPTPAGEEIKLTGRLSNSAGSGGVLINFEIEGGTFANGQADDGNTPETPDTSCTVKSGETQCDGFVVSDEPVERALVRAWIDHDKNPGTVEADPNEGRLSDATVLLGDCVLTEDPDECSTTDTPAVPGTAAEPDGTDVVRVAWFGYGDALIDCDDTSAQDGSEAQYNRPTERTVSYVCEVHSRSTREPIAGVAIDAEVMGGPLDPEPGAAGDVDFSVCETGSDGRCPATLTFPGTDTTGEALVCFWVDGDRDNAFSLDGGEGAKVDGGACKTGEADFDEQPELNDITDSVKVDINLPQSNRLDVVPETQSVTRGSRFTLGVVVYDQFGEAFPGSQVNAELFERSALDNDLNTPSSPDLDPCTTGGDGTCRLTTAVQSDIGANLACVWINQAPTQMFGDPENESSCGDGGEDDELSSDPAPDGQLPAVDDNLDIVYFIVQTRPAIADVSPREKRQETSDTLKILGLDFQEGARISVSGTGVKLGVTRYASATELQADVEVAPDALSGPRDVIVTNLDDGTAICRECFRVIGQGYWLVASDGGIFNFGDTRFAGSTGDRVLNKPIAAMAPTPSGNGYWLVSSDGGVFNFGDAPFLGAAGDLSLNKPIVGIAAHPNGRGYWLVASDGGIFAFGESKFYGSTGRLPLAKPIVAIVAHPSGRGYWLVASDGGVFAFGLAEYFGSTGDIRLNQPIVSMAATKAGKGYWLVASDGGIFSYGEAFFHGGTGDIPLNRPIVAMATTPGAKGYWLVASDGGIFAFGDARFFGSTGDIRLNQPIVSVARR